MTPPLRILFCEPRIPNNTGATMRLAAVTGAIAQFSEGTNRSTKAARIRSARGLSMRQNRNKASMNRASSPIRMRRTGVAKS